MTGIIQEGVREARAKCESNGRPLAHDASFVLDFARHFMVGINEWRVQRARLVLILLDIMAGISQGVSACERRVNSRPPRMTCPLRAPRACLCSTKNANKTKEEDALKQAMRTQWKKFIGMMAQECIIKHCLEFLPFFSLVCCMKLIFHFFFRLSAQLVMKIST